MYMGLEDEHIIELFKNRDQGGGAAAPKQPLDPGLCNSNNIMIMRKSCNFKYTGTFSERVLGTHSKYM